MNVKFLRFNIMFYIYTRLCFKYTLRDNNNYPIFPSSVRGGEYGLAWYFHGQGIRVTEQKLLTYYGTDMGRESWLWDLLDSCPVIGLAVSHCETCVASPWKETWRLLTWCSALLSLLPLTYSHQITFQQGVKSLLEKLGKTFTRPPVDFVTGEWQVKEVAHWYKCPAAYPVHGLFKLVELPIFTCHSSQDCYSQQWQKIGRRGKKSPAYLCVKHRVSWFIVEIFHQNTLHTVWNFYDGINKPSKIALNIKIVIFKKIAKQ